MKAKPNGSTGGITAAEVEAKLPKKFFVRRGHIIEAFGLSDEEMSALVPSVFKAQYLPTNKRGKKKVEKSRAVFVRAQVIAIARNWEGGK